MDCYVTTELGAILLGNFHLVKLAIVPTVDDYIFLDWQVSPRGIFRVVNRMICEDKVLLRIELAETE